MCTALRPASRNHPGCRFNYIDRGISAGAFEQLTTFLRDDLHKDNVDAYLGSLSSAFVFGYAVSGLLFANLVHRYAPFKVMSVGLLIWVTAIFLSGVSPHYWTLLISRGLSGVGEASFQCVVPPYIDDTAPPAQRSLWLALFFMAIPVGTALGFVWGGILAPQVGWKNAFLIEVPILLPLAVLVFFLPFHPGTQKKIQKSEHGAEEALLSASNETFDSPMPAEADVPKPTVLDEMRIVLSSPAYVFLSLGYGAYTFVLGGLAAFGPLFFYYLGLFSSSMSASVTFGVLIAGAGLAATPFGGWLVDKRLVTSLAGLKTAALSSAAVGAFAPLRVQAPDCSTSLNQAGAAEAPSSESPKGIQLASSSPTVNEDDMSFGGAVDAPLLTDGEAEERRLAAATATIVLDAKLLAAAPMMAAAIAVGLVFAVAMPLLYRSVGAALFCMACAALCMFTTSAATNIAIMAAVPPPNRPFAIALATIVQHALGDVPSPTIIGAVADDLAPVEEDADGHKHRNKHGLQITLFIVFAWLLWSVLCWFAAYVATKRRIARHHEEGTYWKEHASKLVVEGKAS